jgi:polysaccharide export outer membrane protein
MQLRMSSGVAILMIGSLLGWVTGSALGASGSQDAYTLGPGDGIEILVLGDADLTRTVTIKPDGTIALPLVGDVTAAGKTTAQLASELVRRYSKYLKAPSITVTVREFRVDRIYILGQVNKPGEYQFRPGTGILELLASAGGPTSRADLVKATLIRGKAEAIQLNLLEAFATSKTPEIKLLSGDVLFLPETDRRIVVLGQVNRPGAYDLLDGQRVTDLLAAAGGVTPRAALQRAFIVRGAEQIPVDVQRILAGHLEANIPLGAGDMLVVPESQDRIAVLGSVNKPGTYDLVDGMKLIDAIALAGGQADAANLSQVQVIRLEANKTKMIAANVGRALSGEDMSQNILLRHGDVVFVPANGVTLAQAAQVLSIMNMVRFLFGGGAYVPF